MSSWGTEISRAIGEAYEARGGPYKPRRNDWALGIAYGMNEGKACFIVTAFDQWRDDRVHYTLARTKSLSLADGLTAVDLLIGFFDWTNEELDCVAMAEEL